jgi:hypothetical protein
MVQNNVVEYHFGANGVEYHFGANGTLVEPDFGRKDSDRTHSSKSGLW